ATNAYHVYAMPSGWASNGKLAALGVDFIFAWRLSGNAIFAYGAEQQLDYILGKNPSGYSMVTGFGDNSVTNPHHRLSIVYFSNAVPGMMVSGLASGYTFSDVANSYAMTEPAINYNAYLIALAGGLHQIASNRTAYFPSCCTLTVYNKGGSTVTRTVSGSSTSLSKTTSKVYSFGDSVTLVANPSANDTFQTWSGDVLSSKQKTISFLLNSNAKVVAQFRDTLEAVYDPYFYNYDTYWVSEVNSDYEEPVQIAAPFSYTYKIQQQTQDSGTYILRTTATTDLVYSYQYTMSLTAKATQAGKVIYVSIAEHSSEDVIPYPDSVFTFTLSTEMQTFTRTFTMHYYSDDNTELRICLGKDSSDVVVEGASVLRGDMDASLSDQEPDSTAIYDSSNAILPRLSAQHQLLVRPYVGGLQVWPGVTSGQLELLRADGKAISQTKLQGESSLRLTVPVSGVYWVRLRSGSQSWSASAAVMR
ncbi:MAG TPA: glycoside hydrolase family 9 protein, partial [Fibrobacteraceae bacterium]|nr:glycoside hydrolase family 9 protein [Fibrobacteraceae bacterium]